MSLSVLKYMHKKGGIVDVKKLEADSHKFDDHFYHTHIVPEVMSDLLKEGLVTDDIGTSELTEKGWEVAELLSDPEVVIEPNKEKLKELGIYGLKKNRKSFKVRLEDRHADVVLKEEPMFPHYEVLGIRNGKSYKSMGNRDDIKKVKEAIAYVAHISRKESSLKIPIDVAPVN